MLAQVDTQDTHVEKKFWELYEDLEQIRAFRYKWAQICTRYKNIDNAKPTREFLQLEQNIQKKEQ